MWQGRGGGNSGMVEWMIGFIRFIGEEEDVRVRSRFRPECNQ